MTTTTTTTTTPSVKRQRTGTKVQVALSAVTWMVLNGIKPSMCFGPAPTASGRRSSATRRYFRNMEYTGGVATSSHDATRLQFLEGGLFHTTSTYVVNDFPVWLRVPRGHLREENLKKLKDSMMRSFFTENDALKLLYAIEEASNGNANKMSGAAEFCLILVETMEMGLTELIAAAFHYCSCVTARECFDSATPGTVRSVWEHNNHNGMESFGIEAMRIAEDAARLKKLETVASMVMKNSELARVSPDHVDAGNLMNLLLTETKDWRALAIRAAASLYRLRGIIKSGTSSELTSETVRAAREALRVYAPLASRLGMHRLKNELEGSAFGILYRRQYETVSALSREIRHGNPEHESGEAGLPANLSIGERMNKVLHKAKEEMRDMLERDHQFSSLVQNFELMARAKEPYSMWKKMLRKRSAHVLDVPDAMALRIVLEAKKLSPDEDSGVTRARERALCYYAMALCMDRWQPHPANPRFKDYIDFPKANGYQSLHYTATTATGGEHWMMEIQVRTKEMHKVAEFGLASHWDYKAGKKTKPSSASPVDARNHTSKLVDRSTEAYVKSLQEWHWEQRGGAKQWHTRPSPTQSVAFLPNDAESQARANRIRARAEQMEPYLEALVEAQSDLAREYVFVFLAQSQNRDNFGSEGKVLALPAGACVVDALREGERSLGIRFPWSDEEFSYVSHNGYNALLTAKLQNGDVLEVPQIATCTVSV